MGQIEKTVFISYRHTNYWTALAIFQNLNANGYDVFFDYKSIPSGDFEQAIVENIKSRAHFVVILSPSALERCNEPGDWLRREMETAIDNQRNIIPLIMEGFDFGSPLTVKALTGKLADLKKYNAIGIPVEYFDDAMVKLRSEKYLNRPLKSVSHPISNTTKQITEKQKTAAIKATRVEKEQLSAQKWFERGVLFGQAKNHDEAFRCFDSAIRLKPNYAHAYLNRGLSQRYRGNLDDAIMDYSEAIRLDQNYVEAFNGRGVARRTKGDISGAFDDFNIAINIQPTNVEALHSRGNIFSIRGDELSALSDIRKASELAPEDGSIRGSFIRVLKSLGNKQEAEEQEKNARELIQKENEYNQACFEAICGNIEEALKLLKSALEKRQSTKKWAQQDPDFDCIRDEPRFKELVGN